MTQEVANIDANAALLEKVVVGGDLSQLTPKERLQFYMGLCESVGLNPLTRPFQYLTLNGKLVLYADKNCAEQLRSIRSVSCEITGPGRFENDLYILTARFSLPDGRVDSATAAVYVKGLGGDALANAVMKCETKVKRRGTLSICGLGMIDDSEVETIPEARRVAVDHATGEIMAPLAAAPVKPDVATKAQLDMIFASAHEHGWTDALIRQHVVNTYGAVSRKDLTKAQASELIAYIAEGNRPAIEPEPAAV